MRGSWVCVAVVTAALAGCGGGDRQDKAEPEGSFRLQVTGASFPAKQSIAERSTLRIQVRNTDSKTAPNVAVTIETAAKQAGGAPQAFAQVRSDPGLADPSRPVWILDRAPTGGETAYTNTWALGPLRAGETKTFEWRVTAVQPGSYTVGYRVSPGLAGKAKLAGGQGAGRFRVTVDDAPPDARIADDGTTVVREAPSSSG
jgi:hypothetical protein